jgi:tetratricopeptide (TPR) repeat protein
MAAGISNNRSEFQMLIISFFDLAPNLPAFTAVALSIAWTFPASGEILPGQTNHIQTAESYLAQGDEFFSKGQYNAAIVEYTRAIALKPDFAAAYNNRGYAAYSKYDGSDALPDLNRALELRPNFPHAYNTRGCIHMAAGRTDEAIADFDRAIELQPDYPRAFRNRGIVLMKKGRFRAAFADFERSGGHPRRISAIIASVLIILALLGFCLLRLLIHVTRRYRSIR